MKHKFKEWSKRYIPAEIFCAITALLSAGIVFFFTKNHIAAAYAGTWGENLGFYSFIAIRDIYHSKKHHKKNNKKYGFSSFVKNLRNLFLEFGFSEIFDSFLIRPFFMYIFPIMLNNFLIGILLGKLAADIIFYIMTISAYELKKKHLID